MLFVPAGNPPHKHQYSPYNVRYEMTGRAITGNDKFDISDIEKKMPDKTYTIEVIKAYMKSQMMSCTLSSAVTSGSRSRPGRTLKRFSRNAGSLLCAGPTMKYQKNRDSTIGS
jgi:hypothetical protein